MTPPAPLYLITGLFLGAVWPGLLDLMLLVVVVWAFVQVVPVVWREARE